MQEGGGIFKARVNRISEYTWFVLAGIVFRVHAIVVILAIYFCIFIIIRQWLLLLSSGL